MDNITPIVDLVLKDRIDLIIQNVQNSLFTPLSPLFKSFNNNNNNPKHEDKNVIYANEPYLQWDCIRKDLQDLFSNETYQTYHQCIKFNWLPERFGNESTKYPDYRYFDDYKDVILNKILFCFRVELEYKNKLMPNDIQSVYLELSNQLESDVWSLYYYTDLTLEHECDNLVEAVFTRIAIDEKYKGNI